MYRTHVNDVLLTALGRALSGWTGHDSVLVALEGHGREEILDRIDLSRTVGWFTTMFPVALHARPDSDLGELLKSVKEQGLFDNLGDTRAELHELAAAVGMPRWTFQDHPWRWHYDLPGHLRSVAVAYGAREVEMHEVGALLKRRKADLPIA